MRRRITSPTGLSLLIPLGVSLAVVAVLAAPGAPAWDALDRTWWARVIFPVAFAPGIFALDLLRVPIPPAPWASLPVAPTEEGGRAMDFFFALQAAELDGLIRGA